MNAHLFAATLLLVCAADAGDESCGDGCRALADAAYKKGEYSRAANFYEQELYRNQQAALDGCKVYGHCPSKPSNPIDYNNLAIALLHAGQPLKARAWLGIAPKHPATTHNKALVDKALKNWRWPASPVGEYWTWAGSAGWRTVTVSRDGDRWGIDYSGDMAEIYATVPLNVHMAQYQDPNDPDCMIAVAFADDSITLNQLGSCRSAGAHVDSSGTFTRVSITIPAAK